MRNNINIKGNDQIFTYLIEYIQDSPLNDRFSDSDDLYWSKCKMNNKNIHLFTGDINYFRHNNDWYNTSLLETKNTDYIPTKSSINISKIRVYLPNHSVSTYKNGIKYVININTWIGGYKIDLGSYIFKPSDTLANENGVIKCGNIEYFEYIEFDIIDPFYLTYSDEWIDFRHNVCEEPLNINNTGSLLSISLCIVNEYDNRYIIDKEYTGGITAFNFSKENEFLKVNSEISLDPLGIKLNITTNSMYNWLLDYFTETYGLDLTHRDIEYEVVIKNKDSVIIGPKLMYSGDEIFGLITKVISYDTLMRNNSIKTFFSSWNVFEEGWNFVISLNIKSNEEDVISIISNEIPITQEVFSLFVNGGSEKIIDLKNMNINNYNIVNKVVNEIIQIERPNNSKSNILQPIFFRVKETEVLTLHPNVTENICINLDDYKSKVDKFILQIDNNNFYQIGANNYGVIFKVFGNKISSDKITGNYYILNEDMELITTGKYNCVK